MFNYGNANEAQKEAISATDGLVLITAGPGTGKTFTLVKRAVYLIQECGIKPEQIMMATFTEKAAKELITRITNELAERNISVNVNEMYIGTFHSLCLRIIKENLEFTRLKRNYRLLDTFDQKYLVFRNFHKFKNIEGIDELLSKGGSWKRSDEICTYINHLSEEMVDIEALQSDDNPGIRTLGRVLSVYQEMLEEGNLIDFSTIQTECYKLLMQNKQILEELQDKLQYLMIDEYQDTNYIQEQIVFLLGAKHHNICVVGDDDQGLYRFRGATIRNILEFPHKFENEGCKIIPLVVNYRSNSDIVDFYNEWISTTSGHKFKFSWDRYRYQKKIEPHVKSDIQSPAVVKLFSKDDEDEWHEKILGFIKELKESGKLTDYNQLAFLFSSVKHQRVTALANFLERNGINVYSPRSDMFFKRDEIKLALGCLMLMFPKYVMKLEKQEFDFLQVEHYRYYRECIVAANEYVTRADNKELLQFIRKHGKVHAGLTGTTDYAYSGLLYKLFMFRPFSDMPVRQNAMMFGTLVHETIEDIHRAAIRGEVDKITNDNIATWFESNYNSLVKSEHTYLAEPQRNAALSQVERYAERMDGKWASVQQAEVDVSLVKEDYIIDGKIDLVKGVDGTVEIVDFKSERKPDMVKMRERLEHYRRQLQIYAYLIEQRTGQKVSKMHLYYTGEENGNPMITYPYTRTAIEGTVAAFDDTVHKILRKDFKHRCDDAKTCKNCDFRYYCNK